LGGRGIICQVDQDLFRYKPKYQRGRAPDHELWVFGIADTSCRSAKLFLKLVQNRTAVQLLPIINEVCREGTVIYCDEYAAYRRISDMNFVHELSITDCITLIL
jgi:hypothetical protein